MLRISEKEGGTKEGRFQLGDPLLGKRPTQVTVGWLNAIQSEITDTIEKSGMTLSKDENQLSQAIVNLYTFGPEIHRFPILNDVHAETHLDYQFDGTKFSAVYFNALSIRHTTVADISFCTSHVAVLNTFTAEWSLLTQAETALFGIEVEPKPQPQLKIVPGPHLLTIKRTGELTYQTSKLPGENHEGSITLSHFRCLRV
jgi:hypothetical protein